MYDESQNKLTQFSSHPNFALSDVNKLVLNYGQASIAPELKIVQPQSARIFKHKFYCIDDYLKEIGKCVLNRFDVNKLTDEIDSEQEINEMQPSTSKQKTEADSRESALNAAQMNEIIQMKHTHELN